MNFLAHFLIAARFQSSSSLLPAYTVGTTLPDLLPLAAPRTHLRPHRVSQSLAHSSDDHALRAGVLSHLAADAAFHKTSAFAAAQAEASLLLEKANFTGIRVRRFFLAHILVELALDAALLRANPALGEDFYAAFSAADMRRVTLWTEAAAARPLPELPTVLEHFAASRYLLHYGTDEGVATGLLHLCLRARQDSFQGENYARLTEAVGEMVQRLSERADTLLRETRDGMAYPPTIPK